jgi:hypothetical protein
MMVLSDNQLSPGMLNDNRLERGVYGSIDAYYGTYVSIDAVNLKKLGVFSSLEEAKKAVLEYVANYIFAQPSAAS